jgi:ribosomal protein L11 methyltransferase
LRKHTILNLNLDLNLILSTIIPYQNLYIYEISGEISDSRNFFKEDFIGCWNEGEISFLFFSQPHDVEVKSFSEKKGCPLLSRNILDYKAWQAGEELKPFKVGNLVISPPWENERVEEGEVLVRLDPCVVFGTGYHPTTQSCLRALWEIYQKEKPKKVLDLGTGSGILALAAAKWGAEKVLAVDCNELAVETALRNVLSNGESQRIEARMGKAEDFIQEEADLVCANIHLQVIESLLKKRVFFKKRWFILSGIFEKDAEEIEKRLKRQSVKLVQRLQEKNWLTLVGLNENGKGG